MKVREIKETHIKGDVKFDGLLIFRNDVVIDGNLSTMDLVAEKSIKVKGNYLVRRNDLVKGNQEILGNQKIGGNQEVKGVQTVIGKQKITGTTTATAKPMEEKEIKIK